jgi:hypothetical protein
MIGSQWERSSRQFVLMTPLEMAVKALGARYPGLVAAQIGRECRDVPAAVGALRQRMPQWFEATTGAPGPRDAPAMTLTMRPSRY